MIENVLVGDVFCFTPDVITASQCLWFVSQNIGSQQIGHQCLIDRLSGISGKQLISPVKQVVHILHEHRLFVGVFSQPGDGMWIEWIIAIAGNGLVIVKNISKSF